MTLSRNFRLPYTRSLIFLLCAALATSLFAQEDEAVQNDRKTLIALYDATNGDGWANNNNWGTDEPLRKWFGITTNSSGRVIRVELLANRLNGHIPAEIANLTELQALNLGLSQLPDGFPLEIRNLTKLERLGCTSCQMSGEIPSELGELKNLKRLDLSYNPFSSQLPQSLFQLTELRELYLVGMGLSGSLPEGIESLTKLQYLNLSNNTFYGEIPTSFNRLQQLENLKLSNNDLTGLLPSWLGDFSALNYLNLEKNQFIGSIPPELGRATALRDLILSSNYLLGEIPSELSSLTELVTLRISDNLFEGEIPRWLGELTNLRNLNLVNNQFAGELPEWLFTLSLRNLLLSGNPIEGVIPPSIAGMNQLRRLSLDDTNLHGHLPLEIMETSINRLDLGGTDICVQAFQPDLREWVHNLQTVTSRIANCPNPHPVYLVQAVQSFASPVRLVADRTALLRVFLTSEDAPVTDSPLLTAVFFDEAGEEIYRASDQVPAELPSSIDESSLKNSTNIKIPGDVVQPNVEMVIQIESDLLNVPKRIPSDEKTRIPLDVVEMPTFELTLVPFLEENSEDHSVIDFMNEMAEQGMAHPLLQTTHQLLPIGEAKIHVHEPVIADTVSSTLILGMVSTLRATENGTGYWLAMLGYGDSRLEGSGVANIGEWTAFSEPDAQTIAHEIGHTMNLRHAPCGGAVGHDVWYPNIHATIDDWGYDNVYGLLVPPEARDVMSYCDPAWISEYDFSRSMVFRLRNEAKEANLALSEPQTQTTLLIWGGRDEDGHLYLLPSFYLEAAPIVPLAGEDYTLSGQSHGESLFQMSFNLHNLQDSPNESVFVYTIPVTWEEQLTDIHLVDASESITLGVATQEPMTIVRDRTSGQIRAFLKKPGLQSIQSMSDKVIDMDVIESRGVPQQ